MDLNDRNWNRLLLATLERARAQLPGEVGYTFTDGELAQYDGPTRMGALLGMDIDDLLARADERDDR